MRSTILSVVALVVGLAVGYLLGIYATSHQAPSATATIITYTQTPRPQAYVRRLST
jgi:ABC-type dipeptide/oligopeptide/nickel transport system permease component